MLAMSFALGLVNDRLKSSVFGHLVNAVYILFLLSFMAGAYFYNQRKHKIHITIELLITEFTGAMFFTMEFLFNGNPRQNIVVGTASFVLMWAAFFITFIKQYKEVFPVIGKWLSGSLSKHILLWVILIVYAVMFSANYKVWFRGDSFTYFSAASLNLDAWDNTMNTVYAFMMGGHLTYSYNMIVNIFMLPLRGFGVSEEISIRIANLVMSEITIALFYAVTVRLFRNLSAFSRAMLTAAFTFSPLFWGISYLASSDFALLCFFTLFIFAYLYDLKIMKLTALTGLCFTKETAVLLPFGFFIGGLIFAMRSSKELKPSERLRKYANENIEIITAILVFTSAMIIGQRGWIHDFHNILKEYILGEEIEHLPDIVIPGHYQLFKLNSLFTAHFMWVVTALIVIYLIFVLVKKPVRSSKANALLISLLFSGVLYYAFELVYFNYVHYRYSQYNLLIMMLLLGFMLDEMVSNNLIKNLVPVIVASLFLTECYFTVDPVTRRTWNTFDSGNGEAVTMQMYFYQVKNGIGYIEGDRNTVVCTAFLNDGMDHNREIIGLQRCVEEGLREIGYDDSKVLVLDSYGEFVSLTCLGLLGFPERHSFNWNPELARIRIKYKDVTGDLIGDEELPGYDINILESTHYDKICEESLEEESLYNEVYYLDVAINPNDKDLYLEGREIISTRVITDGIWQIRLLRLKPAEA